MKQETLCRTILPFTSNKKIKIKAAKSFFKLPTQKDHELALGFLREISFTKDEWKDLLNYMPAQYIELFKDTK